MREHNRASSPSDDAWLDGMVDVLCDVSSYVGDAEVYSTGWVFDWHDPAESGGPRDDLGDAFPSYWAAEQKVIVFAFPGTSGARLYIAPIAVIDVTWDTTLPGFGLECETTAWVAGYRMFEVEVVPRCDVARIVGCRGEWDTVDGEAIVWVPLDEPCQLNAVCWDQWGHPVPWQEAEDGGTIAWTRP